LLFLVPPAIPLLMATAITSDSVLLKWKQGDNGGSSVRGFLLSFREVDGEHQTIMLEESSTSYMLESLNCGTPYQFSMAGK